MITGRDAETVVRLGGLERVPGVIVAGSTASNLARRRPRNAGHPRPDPHPAATPARVARRRRPGAVDRGQAALARRPRPPGGRPGRRACPAAATISALADELGSIHPGRTCRTAAARLRQGRRHRPTRRRARRRRYLGDDLGDIPAFEHLRADASAAGTPTAWPCACPGSTRRPKPPTSALPSPGDAVAFLRSLLG